MSGLEVEHVDTVESIKGGLKGLVVGEVMSKTKHPNADKLNLTKVNIGGEALLDIVCGADNVAEGQKVVIAPVGTTIHPTEGEPFTIRKAKIRGEVSEGMICAEDEISLGSDHDGIMVLDADLKPGTPLTELYTIETDHIIEIAIIPNRGDAISHLGVARELQALTGKKYRRPGIENFDARGPHRVDVVIQEHKECSRYSGITISDVTVTESPDWLKQRLMSIGLKPINNVVDVTNYVQHEIGQPMHAFDFDRITGKRIVVRHAEEGETLVTLDDEERKLESHNLVICDDQRPLAIAGVMGGLDSGVTEHTKTVFLESAYFDPASIRKTAKQFGLNTDSSYRFERGTDPEIVVYALQRAVNLITEIAGGNVTSEVVDVYPEQLEPAQIEIKLDELNQFIGHEIPKEDAVNILQSLEIKIMANNNQNLLLEVPRYRPDVTRPVDIYEEIIRVYGFDNIPIPRQVNYIPSFISNHAPNKLQTKISNYLSSIGFNETINNSLVAGKWYSEKELDHAVHMMNPLSSDMDVLRLELLNSALGAVAYNVNRKNHDVKFYEFGKVYQQRGEKYIEEQVLQITASGNRHPEHWSTAAKPIAAEELTNVAEHVLTRLNVPTKHFRKLIQIERIDPKQYKLHQLKQEVVSVRVNWDQALRLSNDNIELEEIPVYPVVRRDLSLVMSNTTPFTTIEKVARTNLQPYLKDMVLFDVYDGKPLEAGQRSFALGFFLYDPKKTMEDKEIDRLINKTIAAYEKELNAVIRK